ncbi:hypothetical protein K7432_008708 [Basidiobolus ranarum]|uniref:Uncharacterized protein n=1 Tax=Basidiobolus ranarum TaxID=34480 RepID=A0ABR2VY55_9FUNG
MSSAQLHYSSKPISALARQSYVISSTISSEQKTSQPLTPHNALLQTVYRNLRQKPLVMKSEKVLLAAAKSYTPVAHHFLSATEELVNELFLPNDFEKDMTTCEKMNTQYEERSLTTHSAQLLRLCSTRALQCIPEKRVNQISNVLKSVGNFRWTPVSFSNLALNIDEYLTPTDTRANNHLNDNDDEHSLVNETECVEYEDCNLTSGENSMDNSPSQSIKDYDYYSSSQSTSSMVFHDDGPYKVDPDACSDISLAPSSSSILSATDTISTTEYETKEWYPRPTSIPFLTLDQTWLGESTQTVVTVTDATACFVNDKKMTTYFG